MWKKVVFFITHPYLAFAFRVYLGGLFIYASMYKISYAGEFADSIASYQIVPYWLVNVMAVVLPWLELICGALLVLGVRAKSAVVVIGGLLAMFTVAVALNVWWETPMGCGCFTSMEEQMSWMTVLRDLGWLAMAAHVYIYDSVLQMDKTFFANVSKIQNDMQTSRNPAGSGEGQSL